ncbi:hypothetical protein V1478_014391 [Vespula squamosa]|uniref:Uncharacterized protein n=1 Tax=Vespula squamosa TaxID=30214 RepID=A0ABD2A817_VESSQ
MEWDETGWVVVVTVVVMVEKRTARGVDDDGSGGDDGDGGSSADIELQADYHRARINALPRGNGNYFCVGHNYCQAGN